MIHRGTQRKSKGSGVKAPQLSCKCGSKKRLGSQVGDDLKAEICAWHVLHHSAEDRKKPCEALD